ncbi:MAG: winged helix-turn-helix transcriptional regulator, partial [Caldivirga sp.]|nr:winged helix-turn-helix transcriptional regulator [Caldivirga sp.]
MPRKQTSKILERKGDVLKLIRERGEVSTNDLVKMTGLSHSQVFYILRLLQRDGA